MVLRTKPHNVSITARQVFSGLYGYNPPSLDALTRDTQLNIEHRCKHHEDAVKRNQAAKATWLAVPGYPTYNPSTLEDLTLDTRLDAEHKRKHHEDAVAENQKAKAGWWTPTLCPTYNPPSEAVMAREAQLDAARRDRFARYLEV